MADMKAFVKKVAEDKALAESLAKATNKDEFLAAAKQAGYELTEADLAELVCASEGELPDDALEGAAGGSSSRPLEQMLAGLDDSERDSIIIGGIGGFIFPDLHE